jgi:hypothetical protein
MRTLTTCKYKFVTFVLWIRIKSGSELFHPGSTVGSKGTGSRIWDSGFATKMNTQKISKLSENMIWDVYPESGFFSIPAPDPRSRGQKSPEPRIPGLGPQYTA